MRQRVRKLLRKSKTKKGETLVGGVGGGGGGMFLRLSFYVLSRYVFQGCFSCRGFDMVIEREGVSANMEVKEKKGKQSLYIYN